MFESVMGGVFFWLTWIYAGVGYFAFWLNLRISWLRIKARYPNAKFVDWLAAEHYFSPVRRYPFDQPWVMAETEAARERMFVIVILTFGGAICLASISVILTDGPQNYIVSLAS